MHGKCPRCRQGDMFTYPLRRVSKFHVMNPVCPHCGVGLTPEPGFYQGAMYVGYGFTVAFIVAVTIVLSALGEWSEWVYIGTCITGMLLLVPLNFRYSRIVYLYLFGGIKYDPRAAQLK